MTQRRAGEGLISLMQRAELAHEGPIDPVPTQELLRPENYLEVGLTADEREIVINFPGDAYTPAHHTTFSPAQARNLARLLLRKAEDCKT